MTIQDFKPVTPETLIKHIRLSKGLSANSKANLSATSADLEKAAKYAEKHDDKNSAIAFRNMIEQFGRIDKNGDKKISFVGTSKTNPRTEFDMFNDPYETNNTAASGWKRNLLEKGDFDGTANFRNFRNVKISTLVNVICEATGKSNADGGINVNLDDLKESIAFAKENSTTDVVNALIDMREGLANNYKNSDGTNIDANNDGLLEIDPVNAPGAKSELQKFAGSNTTLRSSKFGFEKPPTGGGTNPNPNPGPNPFPPINNQLLMLLNFFRRFFGFGF